MNNILHNLLHYFENVLHPAESGTGTRCEKNKKKDRSSEYPQFSSPESFNIRGVISSKQAKFRINPAP